MSAAPPEEWRLRALERRLDILEKTQPEVLAERILNMSKHLEALEDDVVSLRRALYTFALSFTVGAVALGITLSQVFGG
jgi:hypothetical protein